MSDDTPSEVTPLTTVEELKSWWEIPAIAHFCHIFSDFLELPDFDIEEFEQALVNNTINNSSEASSHMPPIHPLIVKIHILFMKGILEKKEISKY